jgi:hypothetical protein
MAEPSLSNLWLQEFEHRLSHCLGELHHGIKADIVHRVFDFRDMRLRDAGLLGEVALAEASFDAGRPEIAREDFAFRLAVGGAFLRADGERALPLWCFRGFAGGALMFHMA